MNGQRIQKAEATNAPCNNFFSCLLISEGKSSLYRADHSVAITSVFSPWEWSVVIFHRSLPFYTLIQNHQSAVEKT